MPTKDTFLTTAYRSGFIHSHHDRERRTEVITAQLADHSLHSAKSRHAAKLRITRSEKSQA